MAQWLGALGILPEDLGSIPSTHTAFKAVCNSSSRGSMVLGPHVAHRSVHAGETAIHIKLYQIILL